MPIYMDAHLVPGVKAREVARAHQQDLMHQEDFGCKCMTYWVDEQRETIFCLVDAVDKEAVRNLHNKAHGLVPNRIIEVSSSIVQSFLGRIYDPEQFTLEEGIRIFSEASFRYLLLIETKDLLLINQECDPGFATGLYTNLATQILELGNRFEGNRAEFKGPGQLLSFSHIENAVGFANSLLQGLSKEEKTVLQLRMAIHGGEPVENSPELFGDTVALAGYLNRALSPSGLILSADSKKALTRLNPLRLDLSMLSLSAPDEQFLTSLYAVITEHWQDAGFDIPGYSRELGMSASQLYRKSVAITGSSCNELLRQYRLHRAKELLQHQRYSIAGVSYECGFTSPSYFTKCFRRQFGILPNQYQALLQAGGTLMLE